MPAYRTPAVVLRTYDFSEADRVLVLFTLGHGKLRAVAKGVRRMSSRLAGSLSLLSLAELQLYGSEHRELALVTQGQLLHSYPRLKADLRSLACAARMAELVSELVPDRQPLPEVFRLLVGGLELLEDGQPPDVAGTWYEASLLDRLGYRPSLEACGVCGAVGDNLAYHPEAGNLACRCCRAAGGLPLSPGGRRLLAKLMESGPDWVRRVRIPPDLQKEVDALLTAALQHQLGRSLKSDTFRRAVADLG
jgi:DNA repair protein RecO (recombination protein O)